MNASNSMAHAMDYIEEPITKTTRDREAGSIRVAHIGTEASVKTIGWVCVIGAGLGVIHILQHRSMNVQSLLMGLGMVAASFISGVWLLRLSARGRLLYTATLAMQLGVLVVYPPAALDRLEQTRGPFMASTELLYANMLVSTMFGLVLPAFFLYILWSRKGRVVTSEIYQETIIPRAIHVTYDSHVWLLFAILVAVVLANFALAMVAGYTSPLI